MPSSDSFRLNVLLVEDDPDVVNAVRDGFAEGRVKLDHAPTIADGQRMLGQSTPYDALILDLTLPDGDGMQIADACRKAGSNIPIVMVTARDSLDDRIAGLGVGADDYLCKPFAVEELFARLDAVLRRANPRRQHVLKFADVELDLLRRQVRRGGKVKSLSTRELDLLAYLMCHPGEVLSQDQLLREVWGDEAEHDSNVLRVYANYLRNKLGFPRILFTIRGAGYVLSQDDPDERPVADLPWASKDDE